MTMKAAVLTIIKEQIQPDDMQLLPSPGTLMTNTMGSSDFPTDFDIDEEPSSLGALGRFPYVDKSKDKNGSNDQ